MSETTIGPARALPRIACVRRPTVVAPGEEVTTFL
jgi:hypothetical protein